MAGPWPTFQGVIRVGECHGGDVLIKDALNIPDSEPMYD